MKFPLAISLVALFLCGCVTQNPNAEFVGTVNFSPLQTFSYKRTLISGMQYRASDEYLIEEKSELVLSRELVARGFEQVDADSDFYVVTKWRKGVSSYPPIHHHIDGPLESMNSRDDPSYRIAVRFHLIVEIYESQTGKLFWRSELPDIFDAVQFTEERLDASLSRAIKNFPKRVERDPNLPDIE
ncbi:MAG: DUF4136 domain-containing protein [Opitutaceae bacterium]